ncbi:MAG: hypothetical protein HY921_11970 [Elusimicrobia bacterium]|nr:hypothetical protein [Elusimicrobiota bacterium]
MNNKTAFFAIMILSVGALHAAAAAPSPALDQLALEAGRDPGALTGAEGLKASAGTGFTGGDPAPAAALASERADAWELDILGEGGRSPAPNLRANIPPVGQGKKAEKDKKKSSRAKEGIIPSMYIYGALGLGALATAAAIFFFPPLLFLGGVGVGIGGLLWYINSKFQ